MSFTSHREIFQQLVSALCETRLPNFSNILDKKRLQKAFEYVVNNEAYWTTPFREHIEYESFGALSIRFVSKDDYPFQKDGDKSLYYALVHGEHRALPLKSATVYLYFRISASENPVTGGTPSEIVIKSDEFLRMLTPVM